MRGTLTQTHPASLARQNQQAVHYHPKFFSGRIKKYIKKSLNKSPLEQQQHSSTQSHADSSYNTNHEMEKTRMDPLLRCGTNTQRRGPRLRTGDTPMNATAASCCRGDVLTSSRGAAPLSGSVHPSNSARNFAMCGGERCRPGTRRSRWSHGRVLPPPPRHARRVWNFLCGVHGPCARIPASAECEEQNRAQSS